MTNQQALILIVFGLILFFILLIISRVKDKREAARKVASAKALLADYKRISNERKQIIAELIPELGKDICVKMLNGRIEPGFTSEMVTIAWGNPDDVDKEVTLKSGITKFRYVYGKPRTPDVRYVHFKDNEVVKIEGETYRPVIPPENIQMLKQVIRENS
jgi:hypothetical protein